jgi:hypothetical protein
MKQQINELKEVVMSRNPDDGLNTTKDKLMVDNEAMHSIIQAMKTSGD